MALKKLLLDIPFTKKVFKIGTFNNLNSFFKQKIKPNFFLLKRHSADLCVFIRDGPHGSSTGGADGSSPSPLFSRGWSIPIPHSDSFSDTSNHGCQMAIARYLDCMCLALRPSGL